MQSRVASSRTRHMEGHPSPISDVSMYTGTELRFKSVTPSSEAFYDRDEFRDDTDDERSDDELYQPSQITFDADWSPQSESFLWQGMRPSISRTSIEVHVPDSQSVSFIENDDAIDYDKRSSPSQASLRALRQSARELLGARDLRVSRLFGIDPSCLATLDEQLRLSPVDSFAEVCWSEAVFEDRQSILSLDDSDSISTAEMTWKRRFIGPRSDQEDEQDDGYISSPAISPVPATPLPWKAPVDRGYSQWISLPHSMGSTVISRKKSARSSASRHSHPYAPRLAARSTPSPPLAAAAITEDSEYEQNDCQNDARYVPEDSDSMETALFLKEESIMESADFHRPSESSPPSEVVFQNQSEMSEMVVDEPRSFFSSSSSSLTPQARSTRYQQNYDDEINASPLVRPPSPSRSSSPHIHVISESDTLPVLTRFNPSSPLSSTILPPASPSRQIRFASTSASAYVGPVSPTSPINKSLETLQILTFPIQVSNPLDSIHYYPEAPLKNSKGQRSSSAGRQYLRHKSSTENSLRRIASVCSNWSKRLNSRMR